MRIYCDGASRGNPGRSSAAFVAIAKDGKLIAKKARLLGRSTNNVAEYSAVILGLEWATRFAKKNKNSSLTFFLDSQLVVNQLVGTFKIKNKNLLSLAMKAKRLERQLPARVIYKNIPREKNKLADFLANQALVRLRETPDFYRG